MLIGIAPRPHILAAEDLDEPIRCADACGLGIQDVALRESCLDGTECYVRDLQIDQLPGVSRWTPEHAGKS